MGPADERDRKSLTFEQAEGAEPIPSQLQLKELSPALRSALWALVYQELQGSSVSRGIGPQILAAPWHTILYVDHVYRQHRPADEFTIRSDDHVARLKKVFLDGNYVRVFGFLQYVLRRQDRPYQFEKIVAGLLRSSKAAYTVVDGNTIVPIGSEEDRKAVERAFVDLVAKEFNGARSHLKAAAEKLTAGTYADSVRESVHAVHSVVLVLEPTATELGVGLARLEASIKIHGALKAGLKSIYGYTSDAQGIRHPLIDEPVAPVDDTDALFMFGSCAAFVSYLIGKARKAGHIKT